MNQQQMIAKLISQKSELQTKLDIANATINDWSHSAMVWKAEYEKAVGVLEVAYTLILSTQHFIPEGGNNALQLTVDKIEKALKEFEDATKTE